MNEIKISHNMSIDNQLAVTAALFYLNSIREPMRDEGCANMVSVRLYSCPALSKHVSIHRSCTC